MKNDLSQAKKLIQNCIKAQSLYLDLGCCGITNLGDLPELFECKQLETLILSNKWYDQEQKKEIKSQNKGALNTVEFLTEKIVGLKKLRSIKIGGAFHVLSFRAFYNLWNTKDYSFLKDLTQLNSLDLRSNKISDYSFLKDLTQLNSLDLSSNQISDISFLKDLTQLNSLYLSSNQISDISFLKDLTQLNSLYLSSNQIYKIPKFVFETNGWWQFIDNIIEENPVTEPSLEMIKQGKEAVLNWFEEIDKQGYTFLYEAKLLLIGEGGVGKTSLAIRLLDRTTELPKEEETTKGIDIYQLAFKTEDDKDFVVNIWDFGGQEIYKATHQFFLTKRSLYTLVDDTRKNDNNIDDVSFNYWLETVKIFGDQSPLLIVQNEKADRSKELNLKAFKAQFDFVKELYKTNIKTNRGLDTLEKDIKHYVQKLPHIGQKIPKKWLSIRTNLMTLSKTQNHISIEEYYGLYKKYLVFDQGKALELSQYLHDLGSILHFQEDDLLGRLIILQNEWATDAVYRVLDNEGIKSNNGRFSKSELKDIWKEEKYQNMRPELLKLMLKFELCYKITEEENSYLIPQLLPIEEPDKLNWRLEDNLQLRYQYAFMPKGIISTIIVRLHHKIKNLEKAWANGVVLEGNQTWALIKRTSLTEISIRIEGAHQQDLMTIIREEIDNIHRRFPGIEVEKGVPCICETCKSLEGTTEPVFYSYDNLLERIVDKHYEIGCDKKPYQSVNVLALMGNIIRDFPTKEVIESANPDRIKEIIKPYQLTQSVIVNVPSIPVPVPVPVITVVGKEEQVDDNEKWYQKWVIISFFTGLVSFFLSWWILPDEYADVVNLPSVKASAIIGVAVFVLMLKYNPKRWLRRFAFLAFSAFLGSLYINFELYFNHQTSTDRIEFKITETPVIISISLLIFVSLLAFLDTRKNK